MLIVSIHKLLMHAFRSDKPSLRTKALLIQKEMNVADNRQIRFARALMLPGLWPLMRSARNHLLRFSSHHPNFLVFFFALIAEIFKLSTNYG